MLRSLKFPVTCGHHEGTSEEFILFWRQNRRPSFRTLATEFAPCYLGQPTTSGNICGSRFFTWCDGLTILAPVGLYIWRRYPQLVHCFEGLGDVALLGEVYPWEWVLRFQRPMPLLLHPLSLPCACGSRSKKLATAEVPYVSAGCRDPHHDDHGLSLWNCER